MNCPRCGGRLTRYRLGEREAVGCQDCAYVGVSVDHTAERGRPESWDDAIDRFQEQGQSVATVTRDDLSVEVPAVESGAAAIEGELVADEDLVFPVFDGPTTEPDDLVRPVFESAPSDADSSGDSE